VAIGLQHQANMKWFLIIFSIFFFRQTICIADTIYLSIGESRLIDNPNLLDVYLSNSKVLKLKDLNNGKLLLKASSLGRAKLSIGQNTNFYHVVSKASFQRLMELRSQLKNNFGLNLSVIENCPVVSGKLLKISDWKKISSLDFSKKIPNCALAYQMKARVSEDISQSELDKLIDSNQTDYLKISLNNKRHARLLYSPQYEKIAKKIGFRLGIEIQKDIQLDTESNYYFELIAVKDSELKQYGIGLPTSASYNLANGFDKESISGKLNMLYNSGKYTHLQAIALSTLDKQTSKFHSGGEIPVKLVGERNSQITWKAYGFILEVQTTERNWRTEKIQLKVTASNIDSANSIDGIPAIQKQTYSGNFVVGDELQILFNFKNLGQTDSSQTNFGIHWIPFIKDLFAENQIRMENHHLIMIYKPAPNKQFAQNKVGESND
tara:strand:- start:42128 stop:43435 length:1308 start_codon:yes stop_codon:yes gene_type:complete